VYLEYLGWASEFDTVRGKDRHQDRAECLELLLRVPDLTDPQFATGAERDVVVESVRRPLARCLFDERLRGVVLLGVRARRGGEAETMLIAFLLWVEATLAQALRQGRSHARLDRKEHSGCPPGPRYSVRVRIRGVG
jgi:hypothetical protein